MTDRTLNMIRYHSLYPWHTGGSYDDFMQKGDEHILKDVLEFKPDYLFHLGAITSLEECEENPDKAYLTNTISVETAVMIANYLKIHGWKRNGNIVTKVYPNNVR
mgnify:CR=1 FL=1